MEKQDGIETPPAATNPGNARAYVAWGAIVLLVISLALPVVQMPIVGTQNVFGMQDGTAYWFLGFAVLAGVAVFFKRYPLLALPGVLVIGTTLYYVYHFNAIKHDLTKSLQGNIFGALAQGMLATVQLQYGIAVILVAGAALVAASLLARDAATVPGLFSANRRAFVAGAAILAAAFLCVALAPRLFPADVVAETGNGAAGSTPEPVATSAAVPKMKAAVTAGVLSKAFHKADPDKYEFSESFVVKEQYHNVGTKTITGIKGALAVYNQFGDRLTALDVEYEKPLRPGATAVATKSYAFNSYETGDVKFRDTPLARLRVVWEPKVVNFADRTSLRDR